MSVLERTFSSYLSFACDHPVIHRAETLAALEPYTLLFNFPWDEDA